MNDKNNNYEQKRNYYLEILKYIKKILKNRSPGDLVLIKEVKQIEKNYDEESLKNFPYLLLSSKKEKPISNLTFKINTDKIISKFKINKNTLLKCFDDLANQKYLDVDKREYDSFNIDKVYSVLPKVKIVENIKKWEYSISLKLFLEINKSNSIFFAREFNNEKADNFYKDFENIWIKQKTKIKINMLKDDLSPGNIDNHIKNSIESCLLFIADITTTNKNCLNNNVLYEIGLAKGFGKSVILLMEQNCWQNFNKKNRRIPFDISSHNIITYSLDEDKEKKINNIVEIINLELFKNNDL